eukprot:TRINITY_DN2221_c0_g1_i5.p1 TRINITY_DN2221_c0_g1~~TRINITY_DN2221_c0_g1_i5.p1  ORF type:complete len:331 (+),score=73.72 TRINITY_DN2221_c0_g1_i5:377-1369(+)
MNPYAPQRIELPLYFNTPVRKDDLVDSRKYSVRPQTKQAKPTQTGYAGIPMSNQSLLNMSYVDSGEEILYRKRLKDYAILAFACKRANKLRDEGRAYYSSGVLYDNLGQYQEAIKWYKKFLAVCQKIGDTHGIGLSYNCIGVSYQMLGAKNPKFYESAIEYHQKHYDTGDVAGKFIATANIGIVYELMGDKEKAISYHQEALKYAMQVSSFIGQTIAISNIGRIGTSSNMIKSKTQLQSYVEKYLQFSSELKNRQREAEAHIQLGKIQQSTGEYSSCVHNFSRARKIALEVGNNHQQNEASVRVGIASAEMKWADKKDGILKDIKIKDAL